MGDPVFTPQAAATRMAAFAAAASERSGRDLTAYDDLQAWSIAEPDAFWSLVWDHFGVVGTRGAVAAEPAVLPEARFFPGASLNIVDTYLRPVPERDAAGLPAVVQTGEVGDGIGVVASLTREELVERVAAAAAVLRARGVAPGDRIALVLPVGIEALVVTLAGLAVGAVVSSAAPEFGVPAIVDRFGQLHILGGEAAGVVGREHDLDLVVDVGPFGMVVGLLGRQRHAGHEAPGLVEIGELQAALDGIAARNFLPFLE